MELTRLSDITKEEVDMKGRPVIMKRWSLWGSNKDEIWKNSNERFYLVTHNGKEIERHKSLEEAEATLRDIVEHRRRV